MSVQPGEQKLESNVRIYRIITSNQRSKSVMVEDQRIRSHIPLRLDHDPSEIRLSPSTSTNQLQGRKFMKKAQQELLK